MYIEHWNETADGPLSESAMRRRLERQGYACAVYHYPPGTNFPAHTHSCDKIDGVLSGRFRMVIEGREFILSAGDMIVVPRGTRHSAEVVGDIAVISVDAERST